MNSIPIEITPMYLWVALGLLVILALVMGAVFLFHWRSYGFKSDYVVVAESVFIVVTLAILFLAMIGVIIF